MPIQIDLHKAQFFFKYSKIEIRSETSKSGDRSLAIPIELPYKYLLNARVLFLCLTMTFF